MSKNSTFNIEGQIKENITYHQKELEKLRRMLQTAHNNPIKHKKSIRIGEKYRRWTKFEDKSLKGYIEEGLTANQIAEKMSPRTTHAIQCRVYDMKRSGGVFKGMVPIKWK